MKMFVMTKAVKILLNIDLEHIENTFIWLCLFRTIWKIETFNAIIVRENQKKKN